MIQYSPFFSLRVLLILASLGVLFFWFFTSKKKNIDILLFAVGIGLHFFAFELSWRPILIFQILIELGLIFNSSIQLFYLCLLIFQVWLAVTLLLEHGELGGKRFLGILPVLNIIYIMIFWPLFPLTNIIFYLICLGVLILWFVKSGKKGLDMVLFVTGLLLHLYSLIFALGHSFFAFDLPQFIIQPLGLGEAFYRILGWDIFTVFLCFLVWLGLTLTLKHKEFRLKPFPGFLPLLYVLWALIWALRHIQFDSHFILRVPPIILFAGGMIIHHFFKKSPRALSTLSKEPGAKIREPQKMEPAPVKPMKQPAVQSLPCRKAVLTLNSSDIPKLKEQGPDFSAKLLGKVIGFKDRIVFQGLLIAVTHLEPVGPAVVTSETKIKIRSTEDPVILNCPLCGTIQEAIRETCSNCSAELPVRLI